MTSALAPEQLDLFGAVIGTYIQSDTQTNEQLYQRLEASGHVSSAELAAKVPVGRSGIGYSPVKTRIRWWQQRLKEQGIIERVPERRGTWRLAERDKHDLTKAPPKVMMLAHSTELGAAVWGSCFDFFGGFNESIAVCITSPPYPLAKARHYGNPSEREWVDFVCRALEPIVERLLPGGSIACNLSNDIFEAGLPSRSIYRERFVIAMVERFGLHKMDDMPWPSNKAPAPYQWSSRERMQLRTGYEPVLVFCNDPLKSFASNQRVLQPHTEAQKKLIASGGEKRARVNSDGAYRVRQGRLWQRDGRAHSNERPQLRYCVRGSTTHAQAGACRGLARTWRVDAPGAGHVPGGVPVPAGRPGGRSLRWEPHDGEGLRGAGSVVAGSRADG